MQKRWSGYHTRIIRTPFEPELPVVSTKIAAGFGLAALLAFTGGASATFLPDFPLAGPTTIEACASFVDFASCSAGYPNAVVTGDADGAATTDDGSAKADVREAKPPSAQQDAAPPAAPLTEPGTLALLVLGLIGVAVVGAWKSRRRRRQRH